MYETDRQLRFELGHDLVAVACLDFAALEPTCPLLRFLQPRALDLVGRLGRHAVQDGLGDASPILGGQRQHVVEDPLRCDRHGDILGEDLPLDPTRYTLPHALDSPGLRPSHPSDPSLRARASPTSAELEDLLGCRGSERSTYSLTPIP